MLRVWCGLSFLQTLITEVQGLRDGFNNEQQTVGGRSVLKKES
jgi:hypothetical protein